MQKYDRQCEICGFVWDDDKIIECGSLADPFDACLPCAREYEDRPEVREQGKALLAQLRAGVNLPVRIA